MRYSFGLVIANLSVFPTLSHHYFIVINLQIILSGTFFAYITLGSCRVGVLSFAEQNIADFLVAFKVTGSSLAFVFKEHFGLYMNAFTSSSLYYLN